jgi:hypothetical protein
MPLSILYLMVMMRPSSLPILLGFAAPYEPFPADLNPAALSQDPENISM